MEHSIAAESYDRIALSEHEGGLWMTIGRLALTPASISISSNCRSCIRQSANTWGTQNEL